MNTAPVRITHALLILLILPALAASETLSGRVVRVVDGDTVYVLDAAKAQHKVRLGGIDATERGQPFGKRSKERMAELVAGEEVEVVWSKEDRWGRLIGAVCGRVARLPLRRLPEVLGRRPCADHIGAGLALQALR